MEEKNRQPHYFINARAKSGGYVDIGTVFPSEYGYRIRLVPGTKIKITSAYNKESRCQVELKEPIIVSEETHFLNLRENLKRTDKGDGQLTTDIRATFNIKNEADDLPF